MNLTEVKEIKKLRQKDIDRLALKIENAINTLSLENYLDMPDFVIGEMLANNFASIVNAYQTKLKLENK
tara:strand:+ start:773 stop:979 length:207 start_codon:yes stop_codon:yes gene_type:complete